MFRNGAFVNRTSSGSWLLQWADGLFDDELTGRGVTVESTVLRSGIEELPEWACEALQLKPDAQGVALERLRRVDGHIALYVVNHLPQKYAAILPEIRSASTASLYQTLRKQCGVEVAGSSRTLEAVAAPPQLARRLGVPTRYPLSTFSRSPVMPQVNRSTAIGLGCERTSCAWPSKPTHGLRWAGASSVTPSRECRTTVPCSVRSPIAPRRGRSRTNNVDPTERSIAAAVISTR